MEDRNKEEETEGSIADKIRANRHLRKKKCECGTTPGGDCKQCHPE